MDTFEEQENPFDTDDNRNLSSQASSSTKLNISEPSSTPPNDDHSLPTSPYGAFPQQQKADHWLQSSDDIEILVRGRVSSHSMFEASMLIATIDRRRAEDLSRVQLSLHYLCYQGGRAYSRHPHLIQNIR
jgi:hypothetical protein